MNIEKIINNYNNYCEKNNENCYKIYTNNIDFFENNFIDKKTIKQSIEHGNYNIHDKYISIDDMGYIHTSNNINDLIDVEKFI